MSTLSPMTTTYRKLTKTTKVLESLRDDIINGTFTPGEKLQMEQLKERYGVGFSPLREALSRLIASGLVQAEEQCGFCVAPLSIKELHDLYSTRAFIETQARELSMRHGDDRWEADIVAAWHIYSKYLDPRNNNKFDPVLWDALHKDYLFSLVKACQSPWLLKIRDMLYDQASRYRALCLSNRYQNKKLLVKFIKDNERLVAAVLARDIEQATSISLMTCKNSIKTIEKMLKDKI